MNPGNYTIRIEPGNTYARTVTVTADGEPYDLTGYTASMSVTQNGEAVAGVTPTVTVLDAAAGQLAFSFDLTDVAVLDDIEDGRFTLTIASSGNAVVLTILKGRITSNRWANG
jgi:hypothetical protein